MPSLRRLVRPTDWESVRSRLNAFMKERTRQKRVQVTKTGYLSKPTGELKTLSSLRGPYEKIERFIRICVWGAEVYLDLPSTPNHSVHVNMEGLRPIMLGTLQNHEVTKCKVHLKGLKWEPQSREAHKHGRHRIGRYLPGSVCSYYDSYHVLGVISFVQYSQNHSYDS